MSMPDPYKTSRRDFTRFMLLQTCPDNAKAEYKERFGAVHELLKLLMEHEAMTANATQTYMTPAASKNKVYFMWDFVGRTFGMITALDPTLPKLKDRTAWKEVVGRCQMARTLITDKTGKLDTMVQSNDPKDYQFGDEIEKLARDRL